MGGSSSKDDEATKGDNLGVEEISTGFHILEIHVPTVGYGILFFCLIIAIAFFVYRCFKKRLRRSRVTPDLLPSSTAPTATPPPQFPPFSPWTPAIWPQSSMPMIVMNSPRTLRKPDVCRGARTSRIREINDDDENIAGGPVLEREDDPQPQRDRRRDLRAYI